MAPIFSIIFIRLIRLYQFIISPLLGHHCRFKMTCSQYGIEVIQKFGMFKGIPLILKRILRCHPYNIK